LVEKLQGMYFTVLRGKRNMSFEKRAK
jgi:hypothetical protein